MRLIVTACLMAVAPLLFAQQLPPVAGESDKCTIEGRVVHYVTGKPVPQANLTLRASSSNPSRSMAANADEDGRFSFTGVEAGAYVLSASQRGFLNHAYGARPSSRGGTVLNLANGQRIRDLEFRLIPQAVIAGKVLDDRGEPVERASVRAALVRGSSRGSLLPGIATNDLGEFRISGLFPGRYVLGATLPSGPANAVAPPPAEGREDPLLPAFYPSAKDADGAIPVDIGPGQEVLGITLRMRRGPVYRILGKVLGDAFPGLGSAVTVEVGSYPRPGNPSMLIVQGRAVQARPDGSFEVPHMEPGSYVVRAAKRNGTSSQTSEGVPVQVTNGDVKDVVISFRDLLVVTGNVQVEGDSKRAVVSSRIALRPATLMDANIRASVPKPDGSFLIDPVPPDVYYTQLLPAPPGLYIKSVKYGDREVRDAGLDLTGGQTAPITILLGTKPAIVGATVKLDDKPAAGMWVALVPDQYVPRGPTELRTATSDQNGRVRFGGVPPGEYRLYAWEEDQYTLDIDANFLKPFQRNSAKVSAKEGDAIHVEVTPIRAEGSPAR